MTSSTVHVVHSIDTEGPLYESLEATFGRLENIFDNIDRVMKDEATVLFSTKKKGDKYYDFGTKISEDAYEHKGITRYFYDKSVLEHMLEHQFEILRFDDDHHTNPNSTISEWWKILLKKK